MGRREHAKRVGKWANHLHHTRIEIKKYAEIVEESLLLMCIKYCQHLYNLYKLIQLELATLSVWIYAIKIYSRQFIQSSK